LRPAAVIALEGHGLESVVGIAVGSVRARLAVAGPGGHAWTDRGKPSAIHALIDLAAATLNEGNDASPVNIGLIEGGLAVNAIASGAALVLEKRSAEQNALSEFVDYLHQLECVPPLRLTVEILGSRPAGALSREDPLLTTVFAVRRTLGLPEVIETGSTDANAAIALGTPALALGVSHGREMHTMHESIDIESLALGAKQVELVLRRLLRP
jgi:acetylornithine deacetylase/succinyl-diaminopimelate desuccinylase-like protein